MTARTTADVAQRWSNAEAQASYLRRRQALNLDGKKSGLPTSMSAVSSVGSWEASPDAPGLARPPSVRRSHISGLISGSSIGAGSSGLPSPQHREAPAQPSLPQQPGLQTAPAAAAAEPPRTKREESSGAGDGSSRGARPNSVSWGAMLKPSSVGAGGGVDWRDLPTSANNVLTGAGGREALSRKMTAGRSVAGFCWADGDPMSGSVSRADGVTTPPPDDARAVRAATADTYCGGSSSAGSGQGGSGAGSSNNMLI